MKVTSIKTDNIEVAKDLIIKKLISNDIQYVDMGDELLVETDLLIRFELALKKELFDIEMFLNLGHYKDSLNKSIIEPMNLRDEFYEQFINKKTKTDFKQDSKLVKNKTKEYKRRIKHDKGRY